MGKSFINIISDEKSEGYAYGMITGDFPGQHILDFKKKIYACGPPQMMKTVLKYLSDLGVDKSSKIKEEF